MRIIWLYFICFVTAGLEILWQIFKIIYVYDFGKEYIRISIMKSNKFEGRGTIYLTDKIHRLGNFEGFPYTKIVYKA